MKRKSNMELLRAMAMCFIVMLHLFGKTMAIDEIAPNGLGYYSIWTLQSIVGMGNNLFILISGYFFIETRFKTQKLVSLYVQIYFYSVMGALVSLLLGIGLASEWRRVLFPVVNREYWFVTIYIVLYCLSPYIKLLIERMNRRQYFLLLVLLFTLFSATPTVFQEEEWLNTGGAFGIVWFIFLYFVGAYIRLYYQAKMSRMIRFVMWIVVIMIVPSYKFLIEACGNVHWFLAGYVEVFYKADSVLTLAASVLLVLLFVDIDIKNALCAKCINWFGTGCLGVYLIHNNRNLSHYIWEKLRVHYWIVEKENILIALLIGVLVFVVCNVLEHLRQMIFKFSKMNALIAGMSREAENMYHRWLVNENINGK